MHKQASVDSGSAVRLYSGGADSDSPFAGLAIKPGENGTEGHAVGLTGGTQSPTTCTCSCTAGSRDYGPTHIYS